MCLIPVLRSEILGPEFPLEDTLENQLQDSDAGVRAVAEHILMMWQRDEAAEVAEEDASAGATVEERSATEAEDALAEAGPVTPQTPNRTWTRSND